MFILSISVTLLSLLLQIVAALAAVRLIRVTGWSWAWILLAAAVTVITIRLPAALLRLIEARAASGLDLLEAVLTLSVSTLLLAGIARVEPLFVALRSAESALRRSEETAGRRLAEITSYYNTAPIGLAVLDTQLRYVRINERLAELNGQPAAAHIGRTVRDIVPAVADQGEALIRQVIATGQPILNVELSGETASQSGVQRTWLEHWYPLKNAVGKVEAVNVVVEEVTERKKSEKALREAHGLLEERVRERTLQLEMANAELQRQIAAAESMAKALGLSEQKYRTLAENTDDIHYLMDAGGVVLYVGPQTRRLGFAEEEIIARSFLDFVHPEDKAGALRELQQAVSSGTSKPFELRMLSKDGSVHWFEDRGTVRRDKGGAIVGVAGVLRNVTERKEQEAQREEIERRYQMLFRTISDAVTIFDAQTMVFLDVNDAALSLYGWSRDEMLAMRAFDISNEPEQSAALFREMAFATVWHIPLRYHRKRDGTVFPAEISSCRFTLNGRPVVCGVVRDITEQKRNERALLDQQQRLRKLISELSIAEETERRRIADGLHDDISQTLVFAKLRLAQLAKAADPVAIRAIVVELEGYLETVLRTSRSLMFDLVPPLLKDVGMEAAVEDLCAKMTREHGVKFVFEGDPQPAPLQGGVAVILYRSVQELLRNVVKHAGATQASVTIHRKKKRVEITVRDDGCGADEESVRRYTPSGGFGLFTVTERIGYLGGGTRISRVAPRGLEVALTVPLGPVKRGAR